MKLKYDSVIQTVEGYRDGLIYAIRSEEFRKNLRELADYIESLNLDLGPHNRLIRMIIRCIKRADHDSYMQGARSGAQAAKMILKGETDQNDAKEEGDPK